MSLFTTPNQQMENLLQVRANRVAFSSSHTLKQIVLRSILSQKKHFIKLSKLQPQINPFSKIPTTLQNDLLELQQETLYPCNHSKKIVGQHCKLLELLLNKKVTKFKFPPHLCLKNQHAVTQLWQGLLAERPPDLNTIISENHQSWCIGTFIHQMLPVFPNLQVVRLESFECDDSALTKFSQHLPKLRVLEVQLSFQVTRQGVSALCKLTRLQEFIFDLRRQGSAGNVLVWCFELLPRLHVAAYKMTQFLDSDVLAVLAPMTARALSQITAPCTLNLRYLALPTFNAYIPEHVLLPDVQLLYSFVNDPDDETPWPFVQPLFDGCFSKLTTLYMDFTDNDHVMQAVRHVGRQLNVLKFRFHDETEILQLDELLEACPGLSELDFSVERMQSARKLRPDTLQKLHTLQIECFSYDLLQPGLVLQLLMRAPNLRDVIFVGDMLFDEDLKKLESAVKQRTCLSLLERFNLYLSSDVTDQMKTLYESMIVLCERLRDVEVYTRYY